MFGANEIVGQNFFDNAPKDTLMVTSMFTTLQGEGPYSGLPAFFVRLTKCNLACPWCDTFFDSGDIFTYDQLEDEIDKRINHFFNGDEPDWAQSIPEFKTRQMVLVITGGEPSLQKNLTGFLERMQHVFYKTQIESNGILSIPLPLSTTLVCSPKCLEKDGKAIRYLAPNTKMLKRANCLKFVMCADQGSPYSSIPDWAFKWRDNTGNQIFISPMNIYNQIPQKAKELRAQKQGKEITLEERSTVDEVISGWTEGLLNREQNQKNHEYSAKYAIKNGFRFGLQIHLWASVA